MELINKYKHYFLLIAALMLVKVVIEPMYQHIQTERQRLKLSEKRVSKIERLLKKQDHILLQQTQIDKNMFKLQPYLYKINDDASFKLTAQSTIEKTLREANCNIEQVGWDGMNEIIPSLKRWQLKIRFKGGPSCLISSSRLIESLQPLVRIKNFFYAGKAIEENPNAHATAQLELVMWQYITEGDL